MNKEDTKYYNWFREEHQGENCWLCRDREGASAHHIYRRHDGNGRILIVLCIRCDRYYGHGVFELASRPMFAKIAVHHHPEIKEDVWAVDPESRLTWLK